MEVLVVVLTSLTKDRMILTERPWWPRDAGDGEGGETDDDAA
jgi:hypothetical protein